MNPESNVLDSRLDFYLIFLHKMDLIQKNIFFFLLFLEVWWLEAMQRNWKTFLLFLTYSANDRMQKIIGLTLWYFKCTT